NARQQKMLRDLLDEYVNAHQPEIARDRLARVEKAGLDDIRFLWIGSTEPGQPHYYCVQGPTFILEYDCTQDNANHIHAVWRDFDGDFGMDILAQHYRESPHHGGAI